jgi:D-glycero-D-manno-heptose 1,7-bisphosphate phosphatase
VSRPAAFVDRDGTINVQPPEHEYLSGVGDLKVLPGALDGMRALADCGFALVIASNQRGVGRGLISMEDVNAIDAEIRRLLADSGAELAGSYYCPHLNDDDCYCRKPKPGLLLRAAEELDLDLGASWMVGDSGTDIAAGGAAGCRTAYLGDDPPAEATISAGSLAEAADLICAQKDERQLSG